MGGRTRNLPWLGPRKDLAMEAVDSLELLNWGGVVVDPEVAEAVVEAGVPPSFPHDQQGGRLPAPLVSSSLLTGPQGLDHALGQGAVGILEGACHGLGDFRAGQEVALYRVVRSGLTARPGKAFCARVDGGVSVRGNDAKLAAFPDWVGLSHEQDRFPSGFTVPEQAKADRSVAGISQGLAGDRSNARLGVGNDASHGDELGLDGDPKLAGAWVAGDDGKGRNVGILAASSGKGEQRGKGHEDEEPGDHSP